VLVSYKAEFIPRERSDRGISKKDKGEKMERLIGKLTVLMAMVIVMSLVAGPVLAQQSATLKIGYVDLRKAYFDYEKRKTLEKELEDVGNAKKTEQDKLIDEVKTMSGEAELANDAAKAEKNKQLDAKKAQLAEFVKNARQEYMTKQNDMFKQVIDDIEKVTQDIGKQEGYDYIVDSRNVMFAKPEYELTDKVLKELYELGTVDHKGWQGIRGDYISKLL